jgi:hypothetical protein
VYECVYLYVYVCVCSPTHPQVLVRDPAHESYVAVPGMFDFGNCFDSERMQVCLVCVQSVCRVCAKCVQCVCSVWTVKMRDPCLSFI